MDYFYEFHKVLKMDHLTMHKILLFASLWRKLPQIKFLAQLT